MANSGMKKSVVVVDDHPLLREGLKTLIDRSERYAAAGEAGTVADAVRIATQLQPDLITMDVSLPDRSGMDAVREIKSIAPGTKVLMVTMHSSFEYVADAFRSGADGYLVKEATGGRLIDAFDAVMGGEFFMDGQTSREVLQKISSTEAQRSASDDRYSLLSPREQQVMRLVVEGVPSRQIASRLDLSAKTVENHRNNLMKKLRVHSKMELVKYAAKLGLIDLEQWK